MGLLHTFGLVATAIAGAAVDAMGGEPKTPQPRAFTLRGLPTSEYTVDSKGVIRRKTHRLRGPRERTHVSGVTEAKIRAFDAKQRNRFNIGYAICKSEFKKVVRGRMTLDEFYKRWTGSPQFFEFCGA